MEHKFITFDRIEFNATAIAAMTKEDFIAANTGNQFANRKENEASVLADVYAACKAAVEPAKPEAKATGKKPDAAAEPAK